MGIRKAISQARRKRTREAAKVALQGEPEARLALAEAYPRDYTATYRMRKDALRQLELLSKLTSDGED